MKEDIFKRAVCCGVVFGVSSSERKVYSGSKMTWYSTTCGVKTVSYTEYDEQGRIIRTANADGIETYIYRGDEEEPYLEQSCGRQHAVTDSVGIQSQNRRNDQNQYGFRGCADRYMDHGEGCTRFHTAHGKQCA